VKGEDLLWLDRPNTRVDERARADYAKLGLPVGPFASVGIYAPARRGPRASAPMPDTGGRQEGVSPYVWTLREFAEQRLLRFAFADAEDARSQISFVITRVERQLELAASRSPADDPALVVGEERLETFDELVELLDTSALDDMARGTASGTLDAFRRRLRGAAAHMGHLVRGDDAARGRSVRWDEHQVTVVDIHRLHSLAQMFVVGVVLERILEHKEQQGTSRPLVFVLLDELNKYAPRDGWSPIREVLLDIAERGRSLGVSLLGAQLTASVVARRDVANAALRVVGRLDSAEAERGEYGYLGKTSRLRAGLLQPGTMIVSQPEIPTPLLLGFPVPSWATRASEAAPPARDPFARVKRSSR
jgi:DNA helicase HerA-like ATPase